MTKTGALANALRNNGATVASSPAVGGAPPQLPASPRPPQPSRRETKAITVHYPAEVRKQLKMLAVENGRNIDDMVAEALNLLFVKYCKPAIAPRKAQP